MKRWSSGPAIELVPQRLAVDERHHIIKERICHARIEQRQDVGMLEIGGGRDLLEKPLGAEDRREFGPEYLDRDFPLVPEVFRRGIRWPSRPRRGGARAGSGRRGLWRAWR